jgi:hypothetical protein
VITVFTLCSANYLAHAKTLGDSLKQHNPDYHFVIGLVDRLPADIPSLWRPHELVPVEDVGIDGLIDMIERYDVVELNTAVKPFYIDYLYRRDPSVDAVIYLDPDIVVHASLAPLADTLRSHSIVVTPHSCTYDDSDTSIYYEQGMLRAGVYNLGFLATARGENTDLLLRWWQHRLKEHCYYAPGSGIFVDQLWMTLAPVYFDVYVEKHPGYNVCYWNHFERSLSLVNGRIVVNGTHDLVFYHYSSYSADTPSRVTARVKSRTATFSERPDLKPVYDDYRNRLIANGYNTVKTLSYSLRRHPPKPKDKVTLKRAGMQGVRRVLHALPFQLQWMLKRGAQFTLNSFK